MTNPAAEQSE